MRTINIDPTDALELGQLLDFLDDWLKADPEDYADIRVMPTFKETGCSSGVRARKLSA